jgi:phosphoribosylformylglycinamidine synthase subunit PurQ / glutaminase
MRNRTGRARALEMRKQMTPAELTLWKHLRRAGLGVRFRRQAVIGPYIVDFVCQSAKVIIEADGAFHDGRDHDRSRDHYLEHLGYVVLRFENRDIAFHTDWVIEEIKRVVGERV